jgi:hypothetical protein
MKLIAKIKEFIAKIFSKSQASSSKETLPKELSPEQKAKIVEEYKRKINQKPIL